MPVARGYNHYSSYRGRTPLWKKLVAAVLILVIVAAVAVTVLLQQNVVYDDSGRAHIVWGKEPEEKPAAVDPGSLTITVEEAEAPYGKEALRELRATEVAAAPLTEGVTLPEGAVVLTMKAPTGRLYWHSAAGSAAVQTHRTTAGALSALLAEDRYTVARVSCFRDPLAARRDVEGMGLKNTGGFIFYDGDGANWLDPSKAGTREYLCALAVELADMGFDELLLTDFGYPTVGKLNKIDYGETLKSTALAECLQALRDALGERAVKLTLELTEQAVLEGSVPAAGLVLTELAPLADRVAVALENADPAQLSGNVQAASAGTDFLPEVRDVSGLSGSWLLLN